MLEENEETRGGGKIVVGGDGITREEEDRGDFDRNGTLEENEKTRGGGSIVGDGMVLQEERRTTSPAPVIGTIHSTLDITPPRYNDTLDFNVRLSKHLFLS